MTAIPPHRGPSLVRATVLATILLLTGCAAPSTEPTVERLPTGEASLITELPKSADAMTNSIGLNTKLTYFSTPYGTAYSSIVKPKLAALGVRHLRDEGATAKSDGWMTNVYGRMKELTQYGIKFNLIMKPAEGVSDFTQIYQWDRFLSYALPVVEDFEGLNEWDYKCRCTDWADKVRAFQKALFIKVTHDSRTIGRPVFGPSMGNPNNASIVGDLSAYLNYGNIHPYPGGNQPLANVAYHQARAVAISGTRPWIATETGYHNAMNWFGGHPPVSERAASHYIPRLYLEYFRAGFRRAYLTELMDEALSTDNREYNFGLVRYNGSVKPAYTAVQNLIAILKDPGPSFGLSQLSYTLGDDLTGVQRLLLQKRSGIFYLALWQAVSSYDLVNRTDLFPAARNVTLSFPAAVTQVRVFSPLTSASPTKTLLRPTSLALSVPDYPIIVEITR